MGGSKNHIWIFTLSNMQGTTLCYIKLVFFTLFLFCLILIMINGPKIKLNVYFIFISEPNRPLCAEGTAEADP